MAANAFTKELSEMVFSSAKRPGKYLLAALQRRLDKEFQKIYFEQMMYQGAFLAKCRKTDSSVAEYEKISLDCNQMSIQEHKVLVDGEYTEHTYTILNALHQVSRNIQVIFDPNTHSGSMDLVDPNMSSKDRYVFQESIWDRFKQDTCPLLQKRVGHVLELRKSTINHPQAGNGVFVVAEKPLPPGTLLGYFPGIFFTKESMNKAKAQVNPRTELPYIKRWNGSLLFHDEHLFYPPFKMGFGAEEYVDRLEKRKKTLPVEVLPQQINPYALGHFINHPPLETPPNVCLIDFEIPESFFPSFFLKHFPYMSYSKNPSEPPTSLHAVGVISLGIIQNEELFINYGTERFPDNYAPDWLSDPPDNQPISNFLCKDDCLHEFSRLTRMLMKWDQISFSELEKIQMQMAEDRKRAIKEAMQDPKMFERYYKKL